MPTPRPDTLVILAAVEKPGVKMKDEFLKLLLRQLVELGLGRKPARQRFVADACSVETAAIVGDADDDMAAFVISGEPDGALFRLAGSNAFGDRLDAMIGGVAHHVSERILDALEHLAVELGIGAV
jgi:hypothetical protein